MITIKIRYKQPTLIQDHTLINIGKFHVTHNSRLMTVSDTKGRIRILVNLDTVQDISFDYDDEKNKKTTPAE